MKNPILTLGLAALMTAGGASCAAADTIPPVVVKTVPEAGADDVPPGQLQLQVTFSEPMETGAVTFTPYIKEDASTIERDSWSFTPDARTFNIALKLKPNTTYSYWINSPKFTNFRDKHGNRALPYLLTFKTKS